MRSEHSRFTISFFRADDGKGFLKFVLERESEMKLLNGDATMYLALRDSTSDEMASALAIALERGAESLICVVDEPHPIHNLLPKSSLGVS